VNYYQGEGRRSGPALNHRTLRRPPLGYTVSLPAASFEHYLSVLHEADGSRSDTEDVIEEEDEEEEEEPIPPAVLRVSTYSYT